MFTFSLTESNGLSGSFTRGGKSAVGLFIFSGDGSNALLTRSPFSTVTPLES